MAKQPVGFVELLLAPEEAVVEGALLVNIFEVCGFVVAVGIVYATDALCRALFGAATGLVAWVPFFGKKLDTGLHKIEQRLTNAMGRIEQKLDARIGAASVAIAKTVGGVLEEIVAVAIVMGYLEWLILVKYPIKTMYGQIRRLHQTAPATSAKHATVVKHVTVVEKIVANPKSGKIGAAIQAQVRPVKLELRHFERHTNVKLKQLNLELGHLTVPGARTLPATSTATSRAVRRHNKRISRLEKLTTGLGFAALLTAGLSRLGLGWIRCRNFRKAGKATCGMDSNLLDSLLLDTLGILSLLSIVEFAKGLQLVEHEVVGIMLRGVTETRKLEGI